MRKVTLQGTPSGNAQSQINWLTNAVQLIAGASADNEVIDIASAFQLNNTFSVQRSLPASPTLTDVINVLSTLILDFQRGGSSRTG